MQTEIISGTQIRKSRKIIPYILYDRVRRINPETEAPNSIPMIWTKTATIKEITENIVKLNAIVLDKHAEPNVIEVYQIHYAINGST